MFPSLVNCCTLDWYDSWSENALKSVSSKFINEIEDVDIDIKDKLSSMCMFTHKTVENMAVSFDNELRRKVYITPKSYLDSISMYRKYLEEKRFELNETIDRLSNGLKKLSATNIQVAELKTMLTKMEPELKEEKQNASTKAIAIGNESKIAGEQEKLVEEE